MQNTCIHTRVLRENSRIRVRLRHYFASSRGSVTRRNFVQSMVNAFEVYIAANLTSRQFTRENFLERDMAVNRCYYVRKRAIYA